MTIKDPLPTINQAGSTADTIVGDIVKATEIPIEAAIIAAAPIMAVPIWMQIWEKCLDIIFNDIGNYLGKSAGYIVLDVQGYNNLKGAAKALADLQAAQKSGDAVALTKANSAIDSAVAPILHYLGTV